MSGKVTAVANPWAIGWELVVGDLGATQVRTLARAEQQVRDYLDTIDPDTDHRGWDVEVVPVLGPVLDDVRKAKAATAAAAAAQVEAARSLRAVAHKLRSQGLSVADTACVLGVSKGRVSQLT